LESFNKTYYIYIKIYNFNIILVYMLYAIFLGRNIYLYVTTKQAAKNQQKIYNLYLLVCIFLKNLNK
jgi:hypothetical protein